ncbi:MAG: heme-binding domain-containing protein [Leptospiraceae bacterium]|nr:heme-binding domain-containing protein [Leptospiraceae bacterium]MCP5497523.1 heme-binding domain-containing protein [Leptospiraceae bacterium]
MNLKNKWVIYSIGGIVLVWGVSLIAAKILVPEWNPPKRHTGFILNEEADAILKQSCFDCHSNETKSYWYNKMPVISVLLARHIQEGRKELNFSEWEKRPESKKKKAIRKSLEEIIEGEMPLPPYIFMHPEAKIDGNKLEFLKKIAKTKWDVEPELEEQY